MVCGVWCVVCGVCGVVWCGVVWCGVVWCGVVWCGVVWCGVVWCGVCIFLVSHSSIYVTHVRKLVTKFKLGYIVRITIYF